MTSWREKLEQTSDTMLRLASGTMSLLKRQPQTEGTLRLQGLHDSVEIITDQYGIPHVYAQNEADLFFAQGYLHARDRLWQMDFHRRLGSGRLAEIFGATAIEADRFSRRLGLYRDSRRDVATLPSQIKQTLSTYTLGVNAYLIQQKQNLPVEFAILHYRPTLWTVADTLLRCRTIAWILSSNWESELIRALLIEHLGPEQAARLEGSSDPEHPLILPPGATYQGTTPNVLEQFEQFKQLCGAGLIGGSNNWVVAGSKSETGAPILCNDPHLGQEVPSLWYECHLIAGSFDVIGAGFPGIPGILIGHNRSIAWGVTNVFADVQDLYIEEFSAENPRQYRYQDHWEEATVLREIIQVKDEEAVVEQVRITRHGPVINEDIKMPLAIRWIGQEPCTLPQAVLGLNTARTWDEFREALRYWDTPAQNVVYADTSGNIGYQMAGTVPLREQKQNVLPVPGWTGAHEWTGVIPFEELPHTLNPEQGFLLTANNRIVDDSYPYYISSNWMNGYRAQRIKQLLHSKEKFSLADMVRIQADTYSIPATEILPFLLRLEPTTPQERAAQEILRSWDYTLTPESIGAALYTTFQRKLSWLVFSAAIGDDEALLSSYLGVAHTPLASDNELFGREVPLLIRLLHEQNDAWFARTRIPNGPKTWNAALKAAWHGTIDELRERLGDNILRWHYGAVHKLTFKHILGKHPLLVKLFNRGPYPIGGDGDTINMGATLPDRPEEVISVSTYRMIVDLGNLEQSLSSHAPGQSGLPNSKHFDDLIQQWLQVGHHPMLYERDTITAHAEGVLYLHPR
uniref:Peptidase S45 n=1 Tax=Thermosporothrix sp. COM3 TaxID=2490863 RepID=A0A455SKC3_9CHLR|nr:peptidase S45 [Thermosporothrix sp. COM3]